LNKRVAGRAGALIAAFLIVLSSAPAVFADGEVGDLGDTDSIGNVYVGTGSRASVKVDYVHDCPTGVSNCSISVRFGYKCPESWCGSYTYQSWKVLPAPSGGVSTVQADCTPSGDTDNYWVAEYKINWLASVQRTVTITGESEAYVNASGGISYRIIGEAEAVAGFSGQVKGTSTIKTSTATSDSAVAGVVATSGGKRLNTCAS
jgi:hypothetical protein